jgi:putative transposase
MDLEKYKIIQPYIDKASSLKQISEEHNISIRTLWRWVNAYKNKGLSALNRQQRSDKEKSRKLSETLLNFIEGLALDQPRSIAAIYRDTCREAEKLKEVKPSYSLVYKIVKRIPESMLTLAHRGSKAYENKFDILCNSNVATRANEIWQADHCLLDINLQNQEKIERPWLTIIIDNYSRAIAGYYLSFDAPSSIRTSLALRQAIWVKSEANWLVCGIPEVFYTDNGSDFTSEHIEMVCIDLKIRAIFSILGKPRGRGQIERFFLTLNQRVLCNLAGYTKNKKKPKALMTLEQLDDVIKNFLLNEYHQEPHSITKESPMQRWNSKSFLPQMPDSLEKLDLLLLTIAKPRKIRQDGIHFQNLRYMDVVLASYVGESVTIRYDPRDVAEIRVFYKDKFLCRAICEELSGETISFKEIISVRNKRKKELKNIISTRKAIVEQLLSQSLEVQESKFELKTEQESKDVQIKRIKLYEND